MLRWTIRSMLASPMQLAASVGAIAGAFALVLFFEAVFAGESDQIVAYIRNKDADVWVMQKGVSNMHMASSFVSDWKADRIAAMEGVGKVTSILYLNTVMRAGGGNWFAFVVGLEEAEPRAGPWAMASGTSLPGPGEAVVPGVLADLAGIGPGDKVSIGGRDFSVVGLSAGTFSMANSVVFVTMDDLADVMSSIGARSYLLVDARPGVDAEALAAKIRAEIDRVNVLPQQAFIDSDWEIATQMGLEIVGLMTVIGGVLAVMLTGFVVFGHVTRHEREIAVMKALGVRERAIHLAVLAQVGTITAMAVLLAAILVSAAVPLTDALAPQISLSVVPAALVRVAGLAVAVGMVASIFPVRRVVGVDPAISFRT